MWLLREVTLTVHCCELIAQVTLFECHHGNSFICGIFVPLVIVVVFLQMVLFLHSCSCFLSTFVCTLIVSCQFWYLFQIDIDFSFLYVLEGTVFHQCFVSHFIDESDELNSTYPRMSGALLDVKLVSLLVHYNHWCLLTNCITWQNDCYVV